jgi:hypothetical protein
MIMAGRRHHTPEQIVRKLRTADQLLPTAATWRRCAASWTFLSRRTRWRSQYGGLKADDARRLQELERENGTLKRLLADAELERRRSRSWRRETSKPGPPASGRRDAAAGAGRQGTVRLPGGRAARSTQRIPPPWQTGADPDAELRANCVPSPKYDPRWGHRKAHAVLRGEGWTVNHKKIQRLWREEGLRVPLRRRRKKNQEPTRRAAPSPPRRPTCGRSTSASTPPPTDTPSRSLRS